MGANSIRTNLTRESTISEIRLIRFADLHHQFTHIVVEGIDDIRFFQNNVTNWVTLYESFSGKPGVLEIVNTFNKFDVIGICDRDYDTTEPPDHIFYYDYSCLESMMMSSFTAFQKMCNALYPNIPDVEEVYKQTFTQLRWVSSFRKMDHQQGLGINFRCISLFKAFDKASNTLKLPQIISQLRNANQVVFSSNPRIVDLVALEMKKFTDIGFDLLNANGHDALNMFHCLCKNLGCLDFNESVIRISLILAYNFHESSLFTDLKQYADTYNLQIVG